MHHIILDSETDFDGWRKAARTLVLNDVKPADVTWTVRGNEPELFEALDSEAPLEVPQGTFNVPAKFVELARAAILHRDANRFAILYRLLWRLRRDHDLLKVTDDPDVALVASMAKAVHRDVQRMQESIRLREIGRVKSHFVAWFEPEHHIVELAAPFFASRYADMPWSILTSDVCAHWDGHAVSITSGISKAEMPGEDRLEEIWRHHYAGIFNPALGMPTKRNLPEALAIKPESESADRSEGARIEHAATEPLATQQPVEPAMIRPAPIPDSIKALREIAADCQACSLYKNATQTVFGEGPQGAQVIMVGEQPGDKEDLAGKPFVGPAGLMLDRALEEAGIDRKKVYVTNAVKHFKFVPRGKIRLHQKPNTPEIKACRQWYERELASIKPDLVIAMGATAAQCVFNKITPIGKNRGRLIDLAEGVKALVTVHPSYLLRLPDAEAKEREYQRFVEDLKIAAALLRKLARAA
jgi:probable DNA metabolism protein